VALRSRADTSGREQQVKHGKVHVCTFVKLACARMVCFCDVQCTSNTSHGIYHMDHGKFDAFRIICNPHPRSLEVYRCLTSSDLRLGLYICRIHLVAMVYILHIYISISISHVLCTIVGSFDSSTPCCLF